MLKTTYLKLTAARSSTLREFVITPFRAAGSVALTLGFILFGANFLLTFVPTEHYRNRAIEAFEDGVLPSVSPVQIPSFPRRYIETDCLILGMLIADRSGETRVERALSPKVLGGVGTAVNPMCEDTAAAARGIKVNTNYYHRYIHGHYTLSGLLLFAFSFIDSTRIIFLLGILLSCGLIILNVFNYARTKDGGYLAYSALGFGAILFTGRFSYGYTLTIGPSDLVILGFLVAWSLGRANNLIGVASFGAMTAAFDFLTGGLPIGAAIILFVNGFMEQKDTLARSVISLTTYLVAFTFMFAFKAVVVSLVFGPSETATAATKLLSWTSSLLWEIDVYNATKLSNYGVSVSMIRDNRFTVFLFALAKMVYFSPLLTFGSFIIAVTATALLPAILTLWSVWNIFRKKTHYWFILATSLITCLWFFIMLSHTIVHAYFMVRMLGWLACIGLAVAAWELASNSSRDSKMVGGINGRSFPKVS